jgi:uncharacterized membrane protein YkvA (DUF1232 family)
LNLVGILKPIVGRMPVYVRLMYMLYSDPAVSRRRKVHLSVGLLYAVSPIDLVPGFIPVVGQLDDIAIALSALVGALKRIPPDRRNDYLSKTCLSMELIERDLEATKTLMLYLATRPLEYAGRGIRWTTRKVGRVFSAGYQRLQKAKEHVARTRKQT